ncbi:MAG: hypothetical protein LLG37_06070 [Spirochaetia bacterium]|nr:hypothetical protein [Spirochaetia bacterium]
MKKRYIFIALVAAAGVILLLLIKCDADRADHKKSAGKNAGMTVPGAPVTQPGYLLHIPGKMPAVHEKGQIICDPWIIKVDAKGDCRWARTYPNGYFGWAEAVLPLKNGGYVAAVKSYTFGEQYDGVYFLTMDASGNTLAETRLQAQDMPELKFEGRTGLISAGRSYSEDRSNYSAYIAIGNRDGSYKWIKTFGTNLLEWGYISVITDEGGYVTTVNEDSHAGIPDEEIVVSFRDNKGNFMSKNLSPGRGFAVASCADGNYVVAGQADVNSCDNANACLMMVDSDGDLKWEMFYGNKGLTGFYSVEQQPDAGFMACGTSSFGQNGGYDAYLAKTDREGAVKWEKHLGGPGDDTAYFVTRTGDGGYIIAGATASFKVLRKNDFKKQ